MPTYRDSIQDKGFGRTKQYTETGKSAGKEQFGLSAKEVTCNRMENLPQKQERGFERFYNML